MSIKQLLKMEIDRLAEDHLELLYKIICQFPHDPENKQAETQGRQIATLFQEIADAGGLDIADPQEWQRETRKDRSLPFRET